MTEAKKVRHYSGIGEPIDSPMDGNPATAAQESTHLATVDELLYAIGTKPARNMASTTTFHGPYGCTPEFGAQD